MHPSHFARSVPDKVCAMFAADGTALTYGELESRANQGARLLRDAGLRGGDAVVYAIENDAHFLVVSLAAQRIGVYFTPCSTRSTAQEIAYLVQDSGAKVVVLGGALQAQADELSRLLDPQVRRLQCGNAAPGWDDWDRLAQALPVAALDDPQCGEVLLYSSGTTGKPKGIMRPLSDRAFDAIDPRTESLMSAFSERTVFLMPCPLYTHLGGVALSWRFLVCQNSGCLLRNVEVSPLCASVTLSTTVHGMSMGSTTAHGMGMRSTTAHGMGMGSTTAHGMGMGSTTAHGMGMGLHHRPRDRHGVHHRPRDGYGVHHHPRDGYGGPPPPTG